MLVKNEMKVVVTAVHATCFIGAQSTPLPMRRRYCVVCCTRNATSFVVGTKSGKSL